MLKLPLSCYGLLAGIASQPECFCSGKEGDSNPLD